MHFTAKSTHKHCLMMITDVFNKLKKTLVTITSGDYSAGKNIEEFLDENKYPKEVVDFTETLDLMTIKLEAREIALKNTIIELEKTNHCLTKSIKKREFISRFFAGILMLILAYVFILTLIQSFPNFNSYLARVVEASTIIFCVIVIRRSKLPLSKFGFTLKGWKQASLESILFTGVIVLIMVVVKYYLFMNQVPGFSEKMFVGSWISINTFLYIPISFLQEFLARGIIQSALLICLVHKNKRLFAVVMASTIFGAVHANYSMEMALFSAVISLGWGYLFIRTPNIIGPAISHYFIGIFAWLLGFWDYFSNNPF